MKRNVHPVVEAYAGSDASIRTVVQSFGDPGDPAIAAIRLLRDFITGKESANGAFLAARNVDIRAVDADVCLLFLGSWMEASLIQSSAIQEKRSEARTLLHRAEALLSRSTPPELTAYVRLIEARFVGSDGNRAAQEVKTRKALALLQAASPRRKLLLLELGALLAQSGRLAEIDKELHELSGPYTENFREDWLSAIRFINSVEAGQVHLASSLAGLVCDGTHSPVEIRDLSRHRRLLSLMHPNTLPGTEAPELVESPSDAPDWALVIRCLLNGNAHQALRWARLCEKNSPASIVGQDFTAFNLVRAELAEGHADAATRLMEIRRSKGNTHYLDDFFLSRAALLSGDGSAAALLFASTLEASDRYEGNGRLCFELRLATEMPRDAILRLSRSALPSANVLPQATKPGSATTTPASTDGRPNAGVAAIVGSSRASEATRSTVLRLASLDLPVLITGETGTGKELVAMAIHEEGSRAAEPFVPVNCGSISESLLESELFGHEKGAFTGAATPHRGLFEEAGEGTILLDEVGEISARLQVSLLRVLETGEIRPVGSSKPRTVACRILAATNADLDRMAEEDAMRSDVLFRLRRLELHIPPLRERTDDILPLAIHFLNIDRPGGARAGMSAQLCDLLRGYHWPGNVRELRNTIEKMRLMNSDKLHYDVDDVDLRLGASIPRATVSSRHTVGTTQHDQNAGGISLAEGRSRVRRLAALRQLFLKHRLLTRSEIINSVGVSPNTATHDLKTLCSEGFVEKVMPSASPRSAYFVLREAPPGDGAF